MTWSSSDEAVATVSADGVVTACGAGEATITVTTEDGGFTDACRVTVTVPTTGVTLSKDSVSLFAGDSEVLTATVQPADATNQEVAWSTSDDHVATVDASGNVTAVGAGTATITVTTADGGKTATCTVTVSAKTFGISASPALLDFGSVYTGYAQPAAQTVTVTNTGNQSVTLTQPTSTKLRDRRAFGHRACPERFRRLLRAPQAGSQRRDLPRDACHHRHRRGLLRRRPVLLGERPVRAPASYRARLGRRGGRHRLRRTRLHGEGGHGRHNRASRRGAGRARRTRRDARARHGRRRLVGDRRRGRACGHGV